MPVTRDDTTRSVEWTLRLMERTETRIEHIANAVINGQLDLAHGFSQLYRLSASTTALVNAHLRRALQPSHGFVVHLSKNGKVRLPRSIHHALKVNGTKRVMFAISPNGHIHMVPTNVQSAK